VKTIALALVLSGCTVYDAGTDAGTRCAALACSSVPFCDERGCWCYVDGEPEVWCESSCVDFCAEPTCTADGLVCSCLVDGTAIGCQP
jgi:hypothetical protein